MRKIKKSVLQMSDYSVPQDFNRIKLNQNESPLDIPYSLKKEIWNRLKKIPWNRYPPAVPQSLVERLSEYSSFPPENIGVGNGSNELIQTLIYSCCDSKDTVTVVKPGFSVYKRVAGLMDIQVHEVPLDEDFRFNEKNIIEKSQGSRLTILASPNNPTGTLLETPQAEEISQKIPGFLVVDEAYFEFCKDSVLPLVSRRDNVWILRTFSKALGLAGIRLGYLLAPADAVKVLFKAKLPFSTGVFQLLAGEVVLENPDFISRNVNLIIKERERVYREIEKMPDIFPVPSEANFILFESSRIPGKRLYERLYEEGVVLRYFDVPKLKNKLRVTVGKPPENDFFLEKLSRIVKEKK